MQSIFSFVNFADDSNSTNTDVNAKRNAYYNQLTKEPKYQIIRAKILEVPLDETKEIRNDIPIESDRRYQHLRIIITSGNHKGEKYTVQNLIEMVNPYKLIFKKNQSMLLRMMEDKDGKIVNLQVYERVRDKYIYFSIAIFLIFLIMIGGKNGIKSILALVFTGLAIGFILIPLILKGYNPVIISTITCTITTVVSLLLIMGKNKKMISALLGTVTGLIISGIMVFIVGNLATLTGLGNESAQLLAYLPKNMKLDFKGILYAGIIIGALGAIMDVTVSISSAMWEIEEVHPKIKTKDLLKSGLNVGRDIMGSMSNTLILAYAGGSIHLILLFNAYNLKLIEVMNMDLIASEIIRAVAGSIGLVSAIPLTALFATYFRKSRHLKNRV